MAIFLGFTIACISWSINSQSSIVFLLLPVLIIPFIIGLLDDLINLQPAAKLLAQTITGSLVFFAMDIRVVSLYGLGGTEAFPTLLSYALTLLTVVIITNSLNLIDGIDGLAATFSSVAFLFFGSWFFFVGHYPLSVICFSMAGGILAFLFQNWEPSKIFMGDTGSLVIGTALSVVTITFLNENYSLEQGHPLKFSSSIMTAVCALIIPLTDTARIIIVRLYKRLSPFDPDKRHIHHSLVRLGMSHRRAVFILTLVHVTMIGVAVAFRQNNQWLLLTVVLTISISLCLLLDHFISRMVQKDKAETTG